MRLVADAGRPCRICKRGECKLIKIHCRSLSSLVTRRSSIVDLPWSSLASTSPSLSPAAGVDTAVVVVVCLVVALEFGIKGTSHLTQRWCRSLVHTGPGRRRQALPAHMPPKNTETLKNMNRTTAKFARWYVRVLDPKIIDYSFPCKGEKIQAQKFQCILVSKASDQYMLGLVPFDFKDRNAAAKAAAKFMADSVWELTTPSFDTKARPEFNGCPLKSVVLLSTPTTATRVPPTNMDVLAYPSQGVHVALDIKGVVDILKRSGVAPGPASANRRAFDFTGKFLGIGTTRQATKGGVVYGVSDAEFTDAGGGKVVVSVWQGARGYFDKLETGAGVALLGCSAAVENNEVKINMWPGTHICTTGEQAQSLTSLEATNAQAEVLTATFTPGQSLMTLVEEDAHPTCATALADAVAKSTPITFQINRCILDAPVHQDALYTQDGRLFIKNCRLRDGTGGVDVDVLGCAAPALYGCNTAEEVGAQLRAQSLTGVKARVNVRGMLRDENGATKRYIVDVAIAPLTTVVSLTAMRLGRGLSEVAADVVLPVPVSRIVEDPLVGLAVRGDGQKIIGANRVLLLVRGTEKTHLEPLQEGKELSEQTFQVSSTAAVCLLSDPPETVNLVGYCDFNEMLAYRLDKECALILASAVECPVPGSASTPGHAGPTCPTATIEHVTKLSKDEVASLTQSLAVEWAAVLTMPSSDSSAFSTPKSTKDPAGDYWSEERQRKVRRLVSEPLSPRPPARVAASPP